jgi:hypothetical protein
VEVFQKNDCPDDGRENDADQQRDKYRFHLASAPPRLQAWKQKFPQTVYWHEIILVKTRRLKQLFASMSRDNWRI